MKTTFFTLSLRHFLGLIFIFTLTNWVGFDSQAQGTQCAKTFRYNVSRSPIEVVEMSDRYFHLAQSNEGNGRRFKFYASYVEIRGGYLSLNFLLINENSGTRSQIEGKKAYSKMMEHFSHRPIRFIQGVWESGDNYREYLNNVETLGMNPEEAALNTWSGRQAQKFGYQYPRVKIEQWNEEKIDRIVVEFYDKPRTRWSDLLYLLK